MNTILPPPETPNGPPAFEAGGAADPLEQMAGLMRRLLEDPESEAILVPQLLRLSVSLPEGPTRGALESSVAAMARLRGWLQQLQARQRLSTRFSEVTSRLSRVEGLSSLMQALTDEARMMLDAPVARLDVFAPLVIAAGDAPVRAHSGSFIGRLPQHAFHPQEALVNHLARLGVPLALADGLPDALREAAPELDALLRAEGLHGLLLVPLMVEGACCGVMMVGDRMVRQWNVMDVDALQQLAGVAVRAIGRVARADMAQHTLLMLHERQRALRQQMDRDAGLAVALGSDAALQGDGHLGALLGSVPAPQRAAYVERLIGPLRRADQARGTTLVKTLLTYMDHGHNARAAARILGVHVNTLHNRLETIASLMPGWNEPGLGLQVHLALRLALDGAEPGDAAQAPVPTQDRAAA